MCPCTPQKIIISMIVSMLFQQNWQKTTQKMKLACFFNLFGRQTYREQSAHPLVTPQISTTASGWGKATNCKLSPGLQNKPLSHCRPPASTSSVRLQHPPPASTSSVRRAGSCNHSPALQYQIHVATKPNAGPDTIQFNRAFLEPALVIYLHINHGNFCINTMILRLRAENTQYLALHRMLAGAGTMAQSSKLSLGLAECHGGVAQQQAIRSWLKH